MDYENWIRYNVVNPYGRCEEITQWMAKEFPELTRVRGHYYCPFWGERAHWWLFDVDGNIVDPTAKQFPSKGEGHYEQWYETQPEPTGKCPNCGEYTYNFSTCCSDRCAKEYAAYCQDPGYFC